MSDAKPTLMVVDDEPNVLKAVKRLLFDTEYKVLTAGSGQDALKVFEEREVHLVISDYRMPGMNGVEFLSKVKELYPDTVRMVLSGYADVHAVVDAINDGQVYKFVAKPWNDQELLTTIMRAFEQYNLKRENQRLYGELEERNRELQDMADSLEIKVKARTRDLEIQNRALTIAHSILDHLPVGVIGIDPEELVVYANQGAKKNLKDRDISLMQSARDFIPEDVLKAMMSTVESGKTLFTKLDADCSTQVVCAPLPNASGVICLLSDLINPSQESEWATTESTVTEAAGEQ